MKKINNKDKYLKITNKIPVVTLDEKFNLNYNLLSIKKLFIVKTYAFIKFFSAFVTIFFNLSRYCNFLKLKNTKKNKKLLILGGGPSLQKLIDKKNYILKKNIDLMALSYFKRYGNIKLKPTYILSADPSFLGGGKVNSRFINKKNKQILNYLKKNSVKLFLPLEKSSYLKRYNLDVNYFIARSSIFFLKNTNPIMSLSVANMSFFNALSIGLFMGYKKIYFLGLDNTYPRDVWVNKGNKLLNIERFANHYYLADQTKRYKSISDMYSEISTIFYSLNLYKKYRDKIFNLDSYSLTNTFKKKNFKDIFILSAKAQKKRKL
jgi:hypothetical protein